MYNKISDFYVGTTHAFTVLVKINDAIQDISGDTLTLRIKKNINDSDANAVATVVADVTSSGASGEARFVIRANDTKGVDAGKYLLDIEWVTASGNEYVVLSQTINIKERISDA